MITIRKFENRDAEAVAVIMHEAFAGFLKTKLGDRFDTLFPFRPASYWIDAIVKNDTFETTAFVAESEGKIAGYLMVSASSRGLGSLNSIGIDINSPEKGIGHMLFLEGDKFWREHNQRKVTTCVSAHNQRALIFYIKHGFLPEGYQRDHFFEGVDEIMLARRMND